MSILARIDGAALDAYLALAARHKQFDVLRTRELALTAVRYYKGNAAMRDAMVEGQALERRWYASLTAGRPDYGVYDYLERPDQKHDAFVRVPNTTIGRRFNATLRNLGYEQLRTGFWNNRPSVWKKR